MSGSILPGTICFDLGSTLWDDYPALRLQWELLCGILGEYGIEIDLEGIEALAREAILSYAPTLTRAIVWLLTQRKEGQYREIIQRMVELMLPRLNDPAEFRRLNPLLPGAHATLEQLARSHRLAVISNNFASADRWMGFHGIHEYFEHISISGAQRLHKPDVRLFMVTLDALGVEGSQAAMLGDRLDNDIFPAKRLGMTAIRIRQGLHSVQQSRYHMEEPAAGIDALPELLEL